MSVEVNLNPLLESRGKTLYRLCKDIGLSYQQGSAIAKGQTRRIDFDTIDAICEYLGCDVSELIIQQLNDSNLLGRILAPFKNTDHAKRISTSSEGDAPKPFLQWVGGKREMIPQYRKYFPKNYKRYFEPFLGGGAMFFELRPEQSFLNDNNLELIKTYRGVRDNPEEVIRLLSLLRQKHSKELYMRIRGIDREYELFSTFSEPEIAARMIYLNQTCFNGIYRVNKDGQFNVPIGSSLNRLICDEKTIFKVSKMLERTKLESQDFQNLSKAIKKDDFVYLDPPYHPVSQYSDFTRYTKEKFYLEDQVRLRDTVKILSDRGAQVMLSNSDCDFVRNLYKDFNIYKVQSGRNLNCKSEKRGKVSELLITNY